jgi:glycosyltransferase involved in cell wall biosynthesis
MARICLIIPALNEEEAVGKVLADIPAEVFSEIVVVDNNSSDNTASVAAAAGASVILEKQRGYGAACMKGINYLEAREPRPDIVVFLDADYSDYPGESAALIDPILNRDYDFACGSRVLGKREKGAMKWYQLAGNAAATRIIRLFFGGKFTDLGPFRAMKFDRLLDLHMSERTYGWTMEMQIKAVKRGLKYLEVPVSYRPRIGSSKISGTLKGSLLAGYTILRSVLKNL